MGSGRPVEQPPISAELWRRFKAFDATCSLCIQRRDEWLIPGAGGKLVWSGLKHGPHSAYRRIWRVRIMPRESTGIGYNLVDGEALSLADAILSAIEQGESRGWSARPTLRLTE